MAEKMAFSHFVQDLLVNTAARSPEACAVVSEGKRYSYADLLAGATQIACGLQRAGLQRGARVMLYMENGWLLCQSIFGVLMAGGVFMVANPQTKAAKLSFMLDDSEAAVLLLQTHLLRNCVEILPERTHLQTIVYQGSLSEPPPDRRFISLEGFLAGDASLRPVAAAATDLATLIYTSGTTGTPKAVMLSHNNIVFTAGSIADYLGFVAEDVVLVVLPMAFSYGLYQLLCTVAVGARLVVERSFAFPASVYQRIQQESVTMMASVPSIFATMVASHAKSPLCFPTLRALTNAAAALPEAHITKILEIFPNAGLYKMYGQTECARGCYLPPSLIEKKVGSVGIAIPGTEALVLDEQGKAVGPGVPGVLHLRGPHVMQGYWRQPDSTAKALVPGPTPGERMLCTRDWFTLDEEGFLYFVSRSDDIIKTRGEKVSPLEVEQVLHGIEGVTEAAVVGVPDELHGQAVRAYVVLGEGVELTQKDIELVCRSQLENYMVPRDVLFVPSLPKTESGKLLRRALVS